jgi:uncharacterized membrane protein|tara:strand:+ start:78 stop:245 length:168 start_codon:yes stop_codon:yes gene_type:complete
MDKEINKETKKQIKELQETILDLKVEVGVTPNQIRRLQQQLDKLLAKLDKNEDKN